MLSSELIVLLQRGLKTPGIPTSGGLVKQFCQLETPVTSTQTSIRFNLVGGSGLLSGRNQCLIKKPETLMMKLLNALDLSHSR